MLQLAINKGASPLPPGMRAPPMLCSDTSPLILISPTSEGSQAESTPPGFNSVENRAQTQDPKVPSQPL